MLQTVEEYIRGLKLKRKSFGGCDEEDALLKINEISALYENEIADLNEQLLKSQNRINELELKEKNNGNAEKEMFEERVKQMDRLMQDLNDSKNEIINHAKAESVKQIENLSKEIEALQRLKSALASEIKNQSVELMSQFEGLQSTMSHLHAQISKLTGQDTVDAE